MIRKFAYFAIGLSLLGMLIVVGMPWIFKLQMYFTFHQLGMESRAQDITNKIIEDQKPSLIAGFIFNAAGAYAGLYLLRRKHWARVMWIALCAFALLLALLGFCYTPGWLTITGMLFRGTLLTVSIRILCSAAANAEFSNVAAAKPGQPAIQ